MTTAIAAKTGLIMEPKMAVQADETGETKTPDGFRPVIGPLANLQYKTGELAYLVRFDEAPTQGRLAVILYANDSEISRTEFDVGEVTEQSGAFSVPMTGIEGDSPISIGAEIVNAADSGRTCTVDAVLYVEQPLTLAGC